MPLTPDADAHAARAPATTAPLPALTGLVPWLLVGLALGTYAAFFHFPGTTDVKGSFLNWMGLVRAEGIAAAFVRAGPDTLYPPGFYILSGAAQRVLGPACPDLVILKWFLVAGAVAGAAVYGGWCRSVSAAALMLFATALSSIMLGYLDVLYLAPLLLALWALQAGRPAFATGCFAIAVLLKWQPVILAPYFFIQAGGLSLDQLRHPRLWLPRLGWIILGAAAPLLAVGLVISPTAIIQTFTAAVSTKISLSYQGLNPNWLIQLGLYAAQDSQAPRYFIAEAPHWLQLAVCAVFWVMYALVFTVFVLRRRSFGEFLWFGGVGFFTYYLFNIGVHENHLFVCMTLALVLLAVDPAAGRPLATYLVVMANLNLLLFYGISGVRFPAEGARTLLEGAGLTWASVVFSLLNTVFGLACLRQVWLSARRDVPGLRVRLGI